MGNANKPYTEIHKEFLDKLAELIQTPEQLADIRKSLAQIMERPEGGIAKQIEVRKGWFPKIEKK